MGSDLRLLDHGLASTGQPREFVHRVFERQVATAPSAIALELGGASMTYQELDWRANVLATRLRSAGVGPDTLVGLRAERSFEMVTGFLAILKAEGAVVPLDPSYPTARLELMVENAALSVIVSCAPGELPSGAERANLVEVPGGPAERADPTSTDRLSPDHLAYVIYTSGSTGQPKGVMIPHRGLVNLARRQIDAFHVHPGSRVLQFASISFDASVSEILMALLSGATLVLVPQSERLPGAELADTLRARNITIVTLPPSVLAVLPPGALAGLETVISAGEALSPELCATWSREHRLVNAYGPSEVTVCATIASEPAHADKVTIGRAIEGTRVYVVDDAMKQVPAPAIGEICVAGVGLARGYLGRPDLTAERFVPDPFNAGEGARMYRTGDLGRRLPDGQIEFIGRADSQVKLRGFRIELGEIECAVRQLPAVREVAVVVRAIETGQSLLVAFVVLADRAMSPATLRGVLATRLPEHMLPVFVPVEQFPMTANGKIDREALARVRLPVAPGPGPRDELERLVARLWTQALGSPPPDVFSDFFASGGNSLIAATISNGLQEVLGETVYVVAVFDHPTVAGLAEYLEQHYAQSVARHLGAPAAPVDADAEPAITGDSVDRVRQLISTLSPYRRSALPSEAKNPRAVFVLSPPRSGSTLFRVMLAGNAGLFVPQELGLLAFDRLGERRVLANGYEWISQGVIRALIEIKSWTVDEAKTYVEECERTRLPTQELYRQLQEWIHPRLLVDKTTTYALEPSILERAETEFERPFYIHLLRHPCGMIRSFENVRMDRFFFRWQDQPLLSPRRLAETVWVICHQNTLAFLAGIPAARQCTVRYEDVVADPRAQMQKLCDHIGIRFDPGMVEPHRPRGGKMTDGIYADPVSRQIGDPNFHKHDSIDPNLAHAWRAELSPDSLGDMTRELASHLGYELSG